MSTELTAESKAPRAGIRARRAATVLRRSVLTSVAVATLLIAGLAGGNNTAEAVGADGYPTWDEVQAAKNNESAKNTEISNIQGLIATLQTNVETTQAASVAAGDAYYNANQEYLEADHNATELQTQADNESATASDASKKIDQVASQLYRSGGDDTALQLIFSEEPNAADNLLTQLGQMDKLIERNETTYNSAVKAKNSAQSLSDQAQVARNERDRLKKVAEDKWLEAQSAAAAAESALSAQQGNLMTLQAQLAALQDETTTLTTQYEVGVEERRKAEEARKAAEIAEAQRLAAEAEARRQREREEAANQPSQPTQPTGPTQPSGGSGGWTYPSYGTQTSGYGPRYVQCGASYCSSGFHEGVDLASGCGSAIYAAQSGTVSYAGYNGGYGNYIRINHGGGVGTGYGHIQYGGILVSSGQWVNAGDMIALEGNTGNSFGCHVHFEVYINGSTVNPIDYLANRGIYV